jgi:two-component system, chemotaxis family, response regulator Rcp1
VSVLKPQDTQFRILLVEDNAADVRMVVESLKAVTPTPSLNVVPDGLEAIRFLKRKGDFKHAPRPDLILLDLRMPKIPGFSVLSEIKADAGLSSIPVVIQSSSANETDVKLARRLRADRYIVKVDNIEDLTKSMQELVDSWIRPVNILLVEDNAADVHMVTHSLKDLLPEAKVSVAIDGVEALRFLRRESDFSAAFRPDLILLDLRLPKKDGFQVLKEIKQDTTLSSIPVVVLSSSAAQSDINRAYHLRANYYIAKAFSADELTWEMQFLVEFWRTIAMASEEEHNEQSSTIFYQSVSKDLLCSPGALGAPAGSQTKKPQNPAG